MSTTNASSLKPYNKWQSRRWWICLWAIGNATIIMTWLIIRGGDAPAWVGLTLNLDQLIIMAYIAADSFTKPKDAK